MEAASLSREELTDIMTEYYNNVKVSKYLLLMIDHLIDISSTSTYDIFSFIKV